MPPTYHRWAHRRQRQAWSLRLNQTHLPAIARWPDGKVKPVAALRRTLQQEFIEVLTPFITDVEQDGGVSQQLFEARHTDVGSAASQPSHRQQPCSQPQNDSRC